ncbi:cytochrome P450 [Ktedonosporobacter rubrisoli]|uniref:Cytochrome P450 n=1 Tax=Ktedonosporobacter rubrisoli TaxID=2509675 RepID=A0A4P6JQY3_KTERU|nr:cytochrome P450 [Ktedonosporobacter rubrisoli]QBD77186.1 cytochrome P450 [Ktedonosporobacter rubrisoli]
MESTHLPLSLASIMEPAYAANPYALYHCLREKGPIIWDKQLNCWTILGYRAAMSVLHDSHFSAQVFHDDLSEATQSLQDQYAPLLSILSHMMFLQDPPHHTRLRGLVARAFTPRNIEAMRTQIRQSTQQLLEKAHVEKHLDVLHDFAFQVPMKVIVDILGVPHEDSKFFLKWAHDLDALVQEVPLPLAERIPLLQSISECIDYFRRLIHRRQKLPQDNLLQILIRAEEQGDRLNKDELLGTCILLLVAGFLTTSHVISNSLYALLEHPSQMRLLRQHPDLLPQAVTELLRYDSPIHEVARRATCDLHLQGQQIGAGAQVIISLGAANHDPEQFPHPDHLDVLRAENRPLSFGHGIHYCLGASLARMEIEIALETLLQHLHNPVIEEAEWESGRALHGLRKFSLSFD